MLLLLPPHSPWPQVTTVPSVLRAANALTVEKIRSTLIRCSATELLLPPTLLAPQTTTVPYIVDGLRQYLGRAISVCVLFSSLLNCFISRRIGDPSTPRTQLLRLQDCVLMIRSAGEFIVCSGKK